MKPAFASKAWRQLPARFSNSLATSVRPIACAMRSMVQSSNAYSRVLDAASPSSSIGT